MSDFVAPLGPPPPKVPEGWIVRWNEDYKEWFYVNSFTKKSQWEKPTEPAQLPHVDAPAGPPPTYSSKVQFTASDVKYDPHQTRNPYGSSYNQSEDERLARQLQAEEDARARSSTSGTESSAAAYMNQSSLPVPQQAYPGQLPPRNEGERARGLLGKLFGGKKHSSSSGGGLLGGSHTPPGFGGYPAQGGYAGGYPPQQGYYGAPQPGYGGGYPQQPYGKPAKSGGMGMGGAALGLGAGLVGGALIADAINDNEMDAYQDGLQDGQNMDDGGGDFGGDDFGGDF